MKKIIALLLFISGVALGQSTTQPQRAMYGNTTEIQSYPGLAGVFIRYNFNSRTFGVYAKDATDTTSPASDSVIVSTTGTRFKLLTDESDTGGSGGSVSWSSVTGKPSTFTPSAHNQAISTITGLQDSLNARQATITAGTSLQFYRGDKTWATLDKAAVGLGSVQNVDQTNASNLISGTIAAGRFGALTVPVSAMNASGTAGSGTFLRGDGVWASPSSSAVTSVAGRTGTITLTTSDISGLGTAATFNVPSSGNAGTTEVVRGNDTRLTGLTANLAAKSDTSHRHNAAHLTSGTIPAARYGTGTIPVLSLSATGSTADTAVLRRNGTWAVISGGGGSSGLSDPGSNGILARTASGTTTARTFSTSGDGISVTNGTGASGNPTYSLSNDVAAIEALTGTGFPKRTGSDTWAISAVDLSGAEATGTMAAARMPALTGDVTSSAGGVATTYNNVVPASKGGAGTVSGLMKANGSGTVSAAVAGTDYVVPSGNISGTAANVSGTVAVANGGTGATTAANARTNLGATTIGGNLFTLANPSAVTFPRFNADNSITALSASSFLSAIAGAPLANPALTGTPTAPTATAGTNTTQISTTAFVTTAVLPKVSYKTITEVRAFASGDVTANPTVFTTDSGKEGEWVYNSGSSASDNTGTVLVTSSGARYTRVVEDNTYSADWFKVSGDAHTGLAIRRAAVAALASLTSDTTATVIIGKGRNTMDTAQILLPVPKGKKLRIQGEAGSIIDFYHPNFDTGIFSNSVSETYADTTYTHGTVELVDLDFYGGRNPTPSYLSSDDGTMAFLFRNMERVEIRNCRFRSWYGSLGFVGMSGSGVFMNNYSKNVYARQPNVTDSRGDGGLSLYGYSKNFVISGNRIEVSNGKAGRCGVSVDDQCDNVVVSDNVIQGFERGIHIETSNAVIVHDNVVRRSPIAGMSSSNKNVIWHHNYFDATNRASNPELAASAVFFVLLDSAGLYESNTVKGWHQISGTYLAKFWGVDLVVKDNDFRPDANSAYVYTNGSGRKRNIFTGNRFHGKCSLDADNNVSTRIENNTFLGGLVLAQNSTDCHVIGNRFQPNIGATLGEGLVLYGATRPYVTKNIFIDVTSYCIENSATTNGIFEDNTYLRYASGAASYTYFYVSTGIAATGVKKTSPDRYNVIRDYNNNNAYYVGNTGTPTAY